MILILFIVLLVKLCGVCVCGGMCVLNVVFRVRSWFVFLVIFIFEEISFGAVYFFFDDFFVVIFGVFRVRGEVVVRFFVYFFFDVVVIFWMSFGVEFVVVIFYFGVVEFVFFVNWIFVII